ncbi:Regulator of nucleoside diphosphate kinase [compost metagenome]
MPRDVVGLNRWLHYADDRHPEVRRVQLVLPREADIDAGRVSILSHVGAGLIGLKEGESISWPDPSGETRKLTAVLIEDEDPIEAVAH